MYKEMLILVVSSYIYLCQGDKIKRKNDEILLHN